MTTSAVNSLVYQPQGAMEAAAAGHILLSIVAVSHQSTNIHCAFSDCDRSSGSSTSALRLQPPIANSLINSRYTKKPANPSAPHHKI
jgi:hypothetical protein